MDAFPRNLFFRLYALEKECCAASQSEDALPSYKNFCLQDRRENRFVKGSKSELSGA